MHESGIAAGIVNTLRSHRPDWENLRILVRGGHADTGDFDAALRLHLRLAAPGLDLRRVEIVHLTRALRCANCGQTFDAIEQTELCPQCGGGAWPELNAEEISIELLGEQPNSTA